MAFVAGLPPGYTKLNGSTVSLAAQLKQDSDACLAWITENILPAKREQTGFLLCLAYLKNNPAENGYDLLPKLPLELQLPMLRTLANQYASSPGRSLPMVLETIQALPDGLQVEAIRSMAAELKRKPDEPGKSRTAFLALLTQPDQRAAAVEAIAAQELVFYDRNATEPWPFLSELKTTQDKQSAARVVPYIMYLTETQRLEILHRLK